MTTDDRRKAKKWRGICRTLLSMLADSDHPAVAYIPIKPKPYTVDMIFQKLAEQRGVKAAKPSIVYCQSSDHAKQDKVDEVYMFDCGHAFCKGVANACAVKGQCNICKTRPEIVFKIYRDPVTPVA